MNDRKVSVQQPFSSSQADLLEVLANGVMNGDRALLARAITLVESRKAEHRQLADQLLERLHTLEADNETATQSTNGGKVSSSHPRAPAFRIGVTGLPGVGKSTFIDQLGTNLTALGHRVAVLAIDPTSNRTGGSILGDKTRMQRLAATPSAFIRPSPAGVTLGGVARTTRETMLLCEAAGFDVIIVETVGVGQSEVTVAAMVDFFLVLLLPGAGDDLQGLKKGLVELADLIAINKADGEMAARATATAADYRAALRMLSPRQSGWQVPVLTVSGLRNSGLEELWTAVGRHREAAMASGAFADKRRQQSVVWMQALIEDRLRSLIHDDPKVVRQLVELQTEVKEGRLLPALAADAVLRAAGIGLTESS
ncbi:MAG: methylmalonyl Co-A mutase-associated GTPase MeaB [Alphaproteobacteria bacterium]